MNDRVVLDTDTVVDLLRGVAQVRERLATHSPDNVAITSMTLAELLFGADRSSDPERNRSEVLRFAEQVHVLPFGKRSASMHAVLRHRLRHDPIGPNDLVIAATSVAAGARLVTSNTREFARIPELAVESWR